MRALPPTTITILYDSPVARGTGRFYVTVTVEGVDHELGSYVEADEAGAAAAKWVHDRGLVFAPGSGNRLAEVQRLGGVVVIFDVERGNTTSGTMP